MQRAPSWLVQMPGLLDADALAALQQRMSGVDRERMLREMADALEVLATERPLVLWLEDLHWSDYATLDLIAYLARSRRRAQLLVIGTYRPVDVIMSSHPLKAVKQELQMHGRCHELPLEGISLGSVAEYLTAHFPGNHFPADLSQKLYERTEGNPLLIANVVEEWTASGVLKEIAGSWHLEGGIADAGSTVPENLRQMLERQIERLDSHDQALLEAAGIAGVEFSVAAVAAALETDAGEVEQRCETLTRRQQFLRRATPHIGSDGAPAGSYRFLHALHRQVCEDRLPSIRASRLHLQVGRHQEAAYGKHSARIAGELAIHFERGGDVRRAIQYRMIAADKALHTFAADKEAADHLTQALQLIRQHPEMENIPEQKLMQVHLAFVTKGAALSLISETENPEGLISETGGKIGDKQSIFKLRAQHFMLNLVHAKLERAREASVFLLHAAEGMGQQARMQADLAAGMISFYLGEFPIACEHLEQAVLLYDPHKHRMPALVYLEDRGVAARAHLALALWHLGFPDRAVTMSEEAISLAREFEHPYGLAYALCHGAMVRQYRREPDHVLELCKAAAAIATEPEFAIWQQSASILRGWALAEMGDATVDIAAATQGLDGLIASGIRLFVSYFSNLIGEIYLRAGDAEHALVTLAQGLAHVEKTGESFAEAELHRLMAEAMATRGGLTAAEVQERFDTAIAVAQRQVNRSGELRILVAVVRQGQEPSASSARARLKDAYGWFSEGSETSDLVSAKALIMGTNT